MNLPFDSFVVESPIDLCELEARYIKHILVRAEWNKSRAAKTLGVDRRTLYRMMERYKIVEPAPDPAFTPVGCDECGAGSDA